VSGQKGAGLCERRLFLCAFRLFRDGAETYTSIANNSIYGLTASVWTSNVTAVYKIARDFEAGVIWVSCYDLADIARGASTFEVRSEHVGCFGRGSLNSLF